MSPTSPMPTVEELLARYKTACAFNQPVDRQRLAQALREWAKRATKKDCQVRFVARVDEFASARARASAIASASARASAIASARASAIASAIASFYYWSFLDMYWDASIAIGAAEIRDQDTFDTWYPFFEAFEAGCFFFTLDENGDLLVAQPPTVALVDEQNRMHCETGPALVWLSDVREYYWHGVQVSEDIVLRPETITAQRIEEERNAEVRRVMIERYPGGQAKYLMDAGAEEIHRDDYGVLYRKEIPGDESIVMVKVVNSTAEADGSFKDYFLRVPPTISRAREAMAWTFGLPEADTAPALHT